MNLSKREFIGLLTASAAATVLPAVSVAAADPFPDLPLSFTLVCGPAQLDVDMALGAYIEMETAKGSKVSLFADQRLSDHVASRSHAPGLLWSARTDEFAWLKSDHPIHGNPELKFWSRLRSDPDVLALQHFSDRGRFPNSGVSDNRKDVLADAFLTGHRVVAGIVTRSPEDAIEEFASSVGDNWIYRDDVAKVRLYYSGRDHSAQLQRRLSVVS
jgi:hypothetical protein